MKILRVLVGIIIAVGLATCSPSAATTAPARSLIPQQPSAPSAPATETPVPQPTLTNTPEIPRWPLLQKGDWGLPEVVALQRLLRHHGFTVITDDKFGNQTRTAVIEFQSSRGIPADGLVGPITWTNLVQDIILQEGQTGEAVRAVQYLLQYKFGYEIEMDGSFGPETTAAVEDFQINHQLTADGIVGMRTWQALIAFKPTD